jgi:hypothetical protein
MKLAVAWAAGLALTAATADARGLTPSESATLPSHSATSDFDQQFVLGDLWTSSSQPIAIRWPPRPPAPVPYVASRRPAASAHNPSPAHTAEPKPLDANAREATAHQSAAAPLLPTQPMPQVQGLE